MSKLLGYRIKLFRIRKKLSRDDLSEKLGISIHTLTKYEQGQREPNIQTLTNISNLLEISLDTLTCNEFFGYELLCRAIQSLTPKEYTIWNTPVPDMGIKLDSYTDHDILYSYHNRLIDDLPPECMKGMLNYISDNSKEEFIKIYNDLVSTDVYNLVSEIKDYSHQLYTSNKNLLEFLEGYRDEEVPPSDEESDSIYEEIMPSALNSFHSSNVSYSCEEHLKNLIKYKIKDFDFATLSAKDFDTILNNTLDFIEYEIYKIKK